MSDSLERELKQLNFITDVNQNIIFLWNKNNNKTGYVQLFADNNFKLYGLKFIEGDFDEREFIDLEGETSVSGYFMYYKLHWQDNHTSWAVKAWIKTKVIYPDGMLN